MFIRCRPGRDGSPRYDLRQSYRTADGPRSESVCLGRFPDCWLALDDREREIGILERRIKHGPDPEPAITRRELARMRRERTLLILAICRDVRFEHRPVPEPAS